MQGVQQYAKSKMLKVAGLLAAIAALMSLGAGTASAHSIYNTGPHSYNKIYSMRVTNYTKVNFNHVSVNNVNFQYAKSGNANVSGNTFGGHASTGDAFNVNHTNTWISIHN